MSQLNQAVIDREDFFSAALAAEQEGDLQLADYLLQLAILAEEEVEEMLWEAELELRFMESELDGYQWGSYLAA